MKSNHQKILGKLRIVALSIMLATATTAPAQTADPSLPIIDLSTHALFYKLGGGKAVPAPGSGRVTHHVTAHFKGGFGYSCGAFDFQDNLTQMINQIETQVREIPMQLQNAISAAVAGLPGYLMQKINPNLYNIVTKSLDESAELFRLSYKNCQQIEQEMRRDPGANPYAGFMSVSIANKWSAGGSAGNNIADVDNAIKQDPTGPVKWLGGNDYGTTSNPVRINHDLVIAGYNIMLGRSTDVSINTKPTGAMTREPIVQIWDRPSTAGEWLQEVVGDKEIITDDDDAAPTSVTGEGLRPIVADLEPLINDALLEAVNQYDFTNINQYTSINISNGLVDGLRAMPLGERSVFMDRLVSEMAVNEAYRRVTFIRQMLLIGLNAPDIVASQAASDTTNYVRGSTLPDLDALVAEIYADLVLKRTTVNSTALSIINQNTARETSGVTSDPGAVVSTPAMIDGGTDL